ncbi:hypothetical protein H1C71_021432 [Ictidomys tridecemlineatus]|nr:hypothetical protein H1C71_021432 [Ictidomys tridecemlineatus]KAG3268428.1 hypothetical protein H1C71_021432 [Ictidomys tridecemlineatus]
MRGDCVLHPGPLMAQTPGIPRRQGRAALQPQCRGHALRGREHRLEEGLRSGARSQIFFPVDHACRWWCRVPLVEIRRSRLATRDSWLPAGLWALPCLCFCVVL